MILTRGGAGGNAIIRQMAISRSCEATRLFSSKCEYNWSMKLIMAIVQDVDADRAMKALLQAGHRITRLASTGGFFRQGNTTFVTGVQDEQVEEVLGILQETCQRRTRLMPASPDPIETGSLWRSTVEVPIGGATVFVMPVERFEQI